MRRSKQSGHSEAEGDAEYAAAALDGLRRPDRYFVLSPLGEGAVGIVDRVFDARLGRIVARKSLRPELMRDPNSLRAFVNEARILGHLDHGSVIPIFDAYVDDDGRPVYTMREISGMSLARVLRMNQKTGKLVPLTIERTLKIVSQLCEAMAHAHDRGVLHLDLKAQNIIVLEHDDVVLVDWGAARLYAPERYTAKLEGTPELVHLAQLAPEADRLFVGTPRYMSPEQTDRARSELGPASDVFSMGILFFQMLTGDLPFHGNSLEELLFHIRETEPEPPHRLNPGVHRRLSDIVMRMLIKDPVARTASFEEVIGDLDEFRSTAAEFPSKHFAAGEQIFAEGADGEFACVIVEGEVEIWTGEAASPTILARHVEGEVFGELALLREMPRSANATALRPTTVRMIGREALRNEIEYLSPWVLAMLSGVVERFVDRSDRLVEILRDPIDEQGSE